MFAEKHEKVYFENHNTHYSYRFTCIFKAYIVKHSIIKF
jgi:hypothetical protein